MGKAIHISCQRFGRLIAVERDHQNAQKSWVWRCVCDCGEEVYVPVRLLRSGHTQSCGCLHKDAAMKQGQAKKKHGMTDERIHYIWCGMRSRCNNKNNEKYARYGGRGIRVCKEWDTFENFMEWAFSNGYAENLTIDRIDVNGDYCPENCRWATQQEQQNNRANNHRVAINGESHTIAEWARIYGVSKRLIYCRIFKGWDEVRAIIEPKK